MSQKYSRLMEWIQDYFPEPMYSRQDIIDYMNKNVPAWKYISKSDREDMIKDWEEFVAPEIEEMIETKPTIWQRIYKFLGRLIGRRRRR